MTECVICGETEKRLVRHHTNYEKDITVLLCDKCHRNLHNGKLESDIPVPAPSDEKDKSILDFCTTLTYDCYDVLERRVPLTSGNYPLIRLPKNWGGHDVLVLLMDWERQTPLFNHPMRVVLGENGVIQFPNYVKDNLNLKEGGFVEVTILNDSTTQNKEDINSFDLNKINELIKENKKLQNKYPNHLRGLRIALTTLESIKNDIEDQKGKD